MSTYRFSPQAEEDLELIWAFIARDSTLSADRHVARLIQVVESLADLPGTGRVCVEFSATLRSFPVGDYLIFYQPVPEGIEIVRVLHGSRDIQSELSRFEP